MPFCTITTNLSSQELPPDFAMEFAHQVAELLNKPVEAMNVMVRSETQMVRGGTMEPAAVVDIWSIFTFNYEKTAVFVEKIRNFVNEKLTLEHSRIGVLFHEVKPEQVGRPN